MALGLSALLPGELLALVTDILPLHVIFGLGGWLTLSALGVSYKLLPMFLLAGEPSGRRPNTVLLGAASVLVLLLLLVLLTVLDISGVFAALLLGIVTGIGLLLYCLDLSAILKARRRRDMELNSLASLAAFLWLFIAFVWLGGGVFPWPARRAGAGHRLSGRLRLADRSRPCSTLQDRTVSDVARMLRPGAGTRSDAAGSGYRARAARPGCGFSPSMRA